VFEQAQKILRKTFGMELVELRSRAEIHADGNADGGGGNDDDLKDARKAAGVKKKGNYPLAMDHTPQLITTPVQPQQQAPKHTSSARCCTPL
jgi:hypothetical protein